MKSEDVVYLEVQENQMGDLILTDPFHYAFWLLENTGKFAGDCLLHDCYSICSGSEAGLLLVKPIDAEVVNQQFGNGLTFAAYQYDPTDRKHKQGVIRVCPELMGTRGARLFGMSGAMILRSPFRQSFRNEVCWVAEEIGKLAQCYTSVELNDMVRDRVRRGVIFIQELAFSAAMAHDEKLWERLHSPSMATWAALRYIRQKLFPRNRATAYKLDNLFRVWMQQRDIRLANFEVYDCASHVAPMMFSDPNLNNISDTWGVKEKAM